LGIADVPDETCGGKGRVSFKIESEKKMKGNDRPNARELFFEQRESKMSQLEGGLNENSQRVLTKHLTIGDISHRSNVWRAKHMSTGIAIR
jgi:hypothetical protein